MLRIIGAAALATAQPAFADVILPGPPLEPIRISEAQASRMTRAARTAVSSIFDFSRTDRENYLNDAYRVASTHHITAIGKITSVRVVGDRVFVLAIATRYLAPQIVGETYTYIQCRFDESGSVMAINVDI